LLRRTIDDRRRCASPCCRDRCRTRVPAPDRNHSKGWLSRLAFRVLSRRSPNLFRRRSSLVRCRRRAERTRRQSTRAPRRPRPGSHHDNLRTSVPYRATGLMWSRTRGMTSGLWLQLTALQMEPDQSLHRCTTLRVSGSHRIRRSHPGRCDLRSPSPFRMRISETLHLRGSRCTPFRPARAGRRHRDELGENQTRRDMRSHRSHSRLHAPGGCALSSRGSHRRVAMTQTRDLQPRPADVSFAGRGLQAAVLARHTCDGIPCKAAVSR
jgi:hypothetical protein